MITQCSQNEKYFLKTQLERRVWSNLRTMTSSKSSVDQGRAIINSEEIQSRIQEIRGQKIIIDADLAGFYGVETRRLNEQVRRNKDKFPADFMFSLTFQEVEILKSQNAISSFHGGDFWNHYVLERDHENEKCGKEVS